MLALHDNPVSNYYNTVLAVLCCKEIPFREVHLSASGDEAFLAKSPMGKIPFIEHNGHFLSESTVILQYLEAVFPARPLEPLDPLARARVWQLIKFIELYIDAPCRRLFPGVFWFGENHPLHVAEVLPLVERGLAAFDRVALNDPYLMGDGVTVADFYGYFSLGIAAEVMARQYGRDILEERPALRAAFSHLAALPFMGAIDAQRERAMAEYLKRKAAEAKP